MSVRENIAILGAGTWGMTLTRLLANAGKRVSLYTRSKEKAESLRQSRKIVKPIAIEINSEVVITHNLSEAIAETSIIIICCTSQSMRSLCKDLAPHFQALGADKQPVLVSAVKGLELDSLKRMSEVISELIPGTNVCALSGPNLAEEILSGLPTAAVVASQDFTTAASVQKVLSVPRFRIYSNGDIIGVELGGTLKNVIAVAAGGSDGLRLGANAKAALLTRGLAEMTRLSSYMGAKSNTLAGLAGMGDLIATCAGPTSRNYRLGMELARGKKLAQIKEEVGAVIEGVPTTAAVCELSKRLGVELPIADLVQTTLLGEIEPEKAIMALMARPLASE
jgi:glycerol-3-phosphate dehydrogenase (NAD(P)+)